MKANLYFFMYKTCTWLASNIYVALAITAAYCKTKALTLDPTLRWNITGEY